MPGPVDFASRFAAAVGTTGPPPSEAIELVAGIRAALTPPVPPPRELVGDRTMESRWWWAQSVAAHQSSILHQGIIDLWLETTRRAIDCGHRAVATCPPESPDRLTMACFAADLVLDACTFAPWAIAPQLPAVLQSLDQHCALMPPPMAAPRRVRALPMRLAAGASIAEALIVLAESNDVLLGTTWTGPLADATRATARLLGNLGDAERALALLDEVAAGIELSTEATTAQPKPPWLQQALDDVRAGREPAPLDFGNLTGQQVEEASAALVQASDLTHARRATLVDRAMALLELGHANEAIVALDELLALPDPILRTLAQLNRGIARFEAGDAVRAEQDLEAAVAAAGGPAALGWPIVAYLRARIATALGREEARSALQCAAQLTKGTGLEWRTLAALGAHEASKSPADALQTYRTMAAVIAESRRSSLGYRLDSTGLRDKEGHLSAAVRLAAGRGDWRAALEIIETFKARELRAILADQRGGIGPPTDRLDEVERRIDALEFGSQLALDPNASQQELLALRAERVMLLEQDEWRRSASSGLSPSSGVPVDDIVATLGSTDQVAVDLHLDRQSNVVTAVGMRAGTVVVASIELAASVVKAIQRRGENLRSASPDTLLFDPTTHPAVTVEDLLPGAILALLDGATDILISPHRSLHLVSWPAMKWGGRRLLESTAVALTPSLWSHLLLEPAPARPSGVVAFGAPDGPVAEVLGGCPAPSRNWRPSSRYSRTPGWPVRRSSVPPRPSRRSSTPSPDRPRRGPCCTSRVMRPPGPTGGWVGAPSSTAPPTRCPPPWCSPTGPSPPTSSADVLCRSRRSSSAPARPAGARPPSVALSSSPTPPSGSSPRSSRPAPRA